MHRQAVEEIAAPTGESQVAVAQRAIQRAQAAVEHASAGARAAHVGDALLGAGRHALEADVGCKLDGARWLRRSVLAHATLVYLAAVAVLTGAGMAAAAWGVRVLAGGSPAELWFAALVALLPASNSRSRSFSACRIAWCGRVPCHVSNSPKACRPRRAPWWSSPPC